MAQVGIVMGSDSDMPVMAKAADVLEELGISYEMTIISAHREPDVFFEYARTAEDRGFTVATVAINGGTNAGILAAKILAVSDTGLLERLKDYSKSMKEGVQAKDAKLKEVGYKNYGKS